ncbi:MAG TPA: signal peptidase I [Verrucomicrobiae bacterium]|jgi:signal peptidase I
MNLRWFFSSTVRLAADMRKHVQKLLNAQRDILSPQAIAAVQAGLDELKTVISSGADNAALRAQMESLEKTASKWIKPYPYAEWRDNVEVFLVAIVVAMGIRTFFLQPFKIPTGSMQPTLFGIITQDARSDPAFEMPSFFKRAWDVAVHGTIYHEFIAPQDGQIVGLDPMRQVLHFINRQTVWVQYSSGERAPLTVWFGPDDRNNQYLAGLSRPYEFRKGQPILRFKETTGDHLFVDRFSYNFRPPSRGEIIVFKTQGIEGIKDQDQFYIKRLIGLGGETISIGEDRHVRINGRRLDVNSCKPHFENVYGFDPKVEPKDSHYSGHILEPNSYLGTPADSYKVEPGHYFACGDNTANSSDSRYWGELPQNNVIGKSFFVYWPITDRFGWGQQ